MNLKDAYEELVDLNTILLRSLMLIQAKTGEDVGVMEVFDRMEETEKLFRDILDQEAPAEPLRKGPEDEVVYQPGRKSEYYEVLSQTSCGGNWETHLRTFWFDAAVAEADSLYESHQALIPVRVVRKLTQWGADNLDRIPDKPEECQYP